MRTVRKCNSDGTPWMDADGRAFRVDSSFEGSSAEGREVAQCETLHSGREGEGPVTSTWPMASGTSEDQSRGFEGECKEAGCWSGSRGRSHDCEWDRRASPEVATLKECLSKAKHSAEELPVSAQLKGAQEFVERAQKRLVAHDAQRKVLENELAEARVQRLQVLVEARQQVPPPPAEWGAQVTSLQQTVNQLQAERDALAEQVKHQTALKLVERVHPVQSSVDAEQLVLDRASKRRAWEKRSQVASRISPLGCVQNNWS